MWDMSLDEVLKEMSSLSAEEQNRIKKTIMDEFVAKNNIVALQQELNDLSRENNLIRQEASSKFSRKEHQTISFQLGKGIINTLKGQKKIKELPAFGMGLFLDSLGRKNGQELSALEKALHPLVEYQSVFASQNYKNMTIAILKSVLGKLEQSEAPSQPAFDGVYQEVKSDIQPQLAFKLETPKVVQAVVFPKHEITQTQVTSTRLKIACIMDEFTYFCFSPEADLLQLSPDNWLNEISEFKPDILFVESAWQGKESLWKAKVSQNTSEIQQLIKFCKVNSIKTMFWNKEDPVHFGTFIDVAKQVDVVFTTDIDCIGRYKAEVGHDDVYLMPFAAQPKTHNPIEIYERKDAFNFAGSFYLKYPERQRDFVNLTDVALQYKNLDIYDRNYNNPHPHYQFPDQYKPYILGRLEPHEIDKAYKGYVYGINMNTIKQSQSMFARRVFEMIASNTIVLSNYSRGVRNFFGDLVLCSDNKNELLRKIELFANDNDKVDAFKLLGLRKVLAEHTYEDRIQYILEKLKIDHRVNHYDVVVIAKIDTLDDFKHIVSMYNSQHYVDKQLYIFNPNHIKLDDIDQINVFEQQDQLIKTLADLAPQYVALMSATDYYLADYLTDMMLSFKYLKSHDADVVTKDAYYTQSSSQLSKVIGTEYQFVDQFILAKTVAKYTESTSKWIEQFFINTATRIDEQAFSIDKFNYIANCQTLTDLEQAKVAGDLHGLDKGVELKEKLLPLAEQIQAVSSGQGVKFEFDLQYFKEKMVSNYKLITIEHSVDQCLIKSQLEKDKHRYIPILIEQNITGASIELAVAAQATMRTQAVIEFYDRNADRIDFKVFEVNQAEKIAIPNHAQTFTLSLRVKGAGQVTLERVSYQQGSAESSSEEGKNSSIVVLDANMFNQELVKGSSNQIQFAKPNDQQFVIKTTLAPAKHAYMYMKRIFNREELNLVLNSEFELKAQTTAEDVRIVFEFQDEHNQKISHSMNPILGGHALAIPMECKYIRIGLKVVGTGITEISGLHIGVVKNPIHTFIPKSDVLVLAKQYPSYDDLYKYGFLHTRLQAYKKEAQSVDMFKVTIKAEDYGFSEFEGIDVVSHSHAMLDKLLATGQHKKVCVHLIDNKMWEILKKYKDKVEIIIWLHGAEIRSWKRREYEAETLSEAEVVRQQKLSDQRQRFWRQLLLSELNSNIHFVFVSQYFRDESEEDLGVKFPDEQCHIIHNYIDAETFNYVEKPADQRFKLLSIRPFANKTYANDMTVNAILELAKKHNFNKFDIAIYGDGALFDEVTAPLKKFSNVKLHKTFLTHAEIAELHKQYGVFIVPTRMDSQGVSRGEAMASGLVSVTTKVAAIPEFVDTQSAVLVDAEDYKAIAHQVYELSKNTRKFKQLSLNASQRVNLQCSYNETVMKEVKLLG